MKPTTSLSLSYRFQTNVMTNVELQYFVSHYVTK